MRQKIGPSPGGKSLTRNPTVLPCLASVLPSFKKILGWFLEFLEIAGGGLEGGSRTTPPGPFPLGSDVEAEEHDVSILNDVLFAFRADEPLFASPFPPLVGDKVAE